MKSKLNSLVSHIKSGDVIPYVCAYLIRRTNGLFYKNPASFGKYYKQQSKLKFLDNRAAFYMKNGYWPNLKKPRSFNEKCLYLKLFSRNPVLPVIADKYTVRDVVAARVGSEVLVPLHQVVEIPQDIDFERLPEKFVIKASWASGRNIIVKEKRSLNPESVVAQCQAWIKERYRIRELIWFCQGMKRRIIVEKFISDEQRSLPVDYKFYVFDGKVRFCNTVSDRDQSRKMSFYDRDWQCLPVKKEQFANEPTLSRPKGYEEMIGIAETLARGFDFMRVDLYNVNNKVMFGELTSYPANGRSRFTPRSFDYELGKFWQMDLTHMAQ